MKQLNAFYDAQTNSLTYVLWDRDHLDAVVIDPVWDFDLSTGQLSEMQHQRICSFLKEKDLTPILVLETHVHADHLSGSALMKRDFPQLRVAIGKNIKTVQEIFVPLFNFKNTPCDGSQFDLLLEDDSVLKLGSFEIKVLHTPGHTPACSSFLIENHLFTGDALFMPDAGTGRCDFPHADARTLYRSIQRLYQLDDDVRVHPGHDYQPDGRELRFEASLHEHKKNNIHLQTSTTEEDFVHFRQERDKTLAPPKLLFPSLQVNIRGGELPQAEDNNTRYLRIPLKS